MHVEMVIKGLMVDPITNMPIVLLHDRDGSRVLPIWIGVFEANAIALQIENQTTPRPMTHDLLRNVIADLKAAVDRVVVTELKDNTFYTVQDQGRWGYQAYGVGISGAMDSLALAAGNLLVGNPERAAGLEMTLQGPSLKSHGETWFAVTGADLGPRLDGSPISNWAAHRAPSGSVLSFGSRRSGVHAYLSVAGGLDVPVVMDSRSTYLLGRFGGLEGRPLKAQDRLPVGFEAQVRPPREGFVFPENLRPAYRKNSRLRAVLGPFGGAFVLFSDHIGLRGDVRYLKDPRERVQRISNARFVGEVLAFDAFSFARTTAGFVWRF